MSKAPYNRIASEYYSGKHQTSRNFDQVTVCALREIANTEFGGKILELGAGRGRVGEFLSIPPERVVQLDNSEQMLSLEDREPCHVKVLADARSIPLAAEQFSAVAGFLVDPFIGLLSLSEAYRVLAPNGRLLLTTPTYEWGAPLRERLQINLMCTRFRVHAENVEVRLPSYLFLKNQLLEMLRHIGFVEIAISDHSLSSDADTISPDIVTVCDQLGRSCDELPILHVIQARRN